MKPEWVLAGLIALIFWLPGPIDHFWEIRVSFYETAKLVRYLSLLDFILIVSLFILPKSKYSRFRKIDLFVGVLLFFLIILSLINLIWHFQFLDPVRKPALLTGLIFFRIFIVFFIVQKSVNLSVDLIKIYIGVILGTLGLIVNSGYKYFTGENMIGRLIAGTFGNNIFGVLLAIMALMIESYKNFVHSKSLRVFLTIVQFICLTFLFSFL